MAAHENITKFSELKIGSNKNFCLTFSAVFFFMGIYPLIHSAPLRMWGLAVSGAFLILAFTKPQLIRPFNYTWARIGMILGKIMVPLVMGILYFSVFFLTGVVMRLLKRDALQLNFGSSQKTYWLKRTDDCFPEESFENQF